MLNFIVSNQKNICLIDTIKYILQVFPEAVIIRDPTDEISPTVFINDTAKLELEGRSPDYVLSYFFKFFQSWRTVNICSRAVYRCV